MTSSRRWQNQRRTGMPQPAHKRLRAARRRCRPGDQLRSTTQIRDSDPRRRPFFADHSSTTGLLIETGLMNTIEVRDDLAIIGTGARLAEVYRVLHHHGATIPAACGPAVGIAGLALGGGLGVLGRAYGLVHGSRLQRLGVSSRVASYSTYGGLDRGGHHAAGPRPSP